MRRSIFAIVTVSLTFLLGCSDNANSTAASSATSGSASSSSTSSTSSSSGSSSGGGGSGSKETLVGVTLDDISDLPAITQSLKSLTIRPTARIVFDEFIPATNYLDAVTTIHPSSDIMGEILDSYYVALYTPGDYSARTTEYVDLLGTNVDIWEIGNEINGEWVCDQNALSCTDQQTADVVAKMTAAYEIVKAHGRPTALTLYYNEDCYSDAKNEVFTWTAANVPEKLKQGLDYVFFSYYEDDCNDLQPDWPTAFGKLAAMFPNSKLGFGECGTTKSAEKAAYVDRYYRRTLNVPRYVGGQFWWYFRQDMVPMAAPLWKTLDDAIAGR